MSKRDNTLDIRYGNPAFSVIQFIPYLYHPPSSIHLNIMTLKHFWPILIIWVSVSLISPPPLWVPRVIRGGQGRGTHHSPLEKALWSVFVNDLMFHALNLVSCSSVSICKALFVSIRDLLLSISLFEYIFVLNPIPRSQFAVNMYVDPVLDLTFNGSDFVWMMVLHVISSSFSWD